MIRTIKSDKLIIAANQNLKEKEYWLNQFSGEIPREDLEDFAF